jgi:hypothetical protein
MQLEAFRRLTEARALLTIGFLGSVDMPSPKNEVVRDRALTKAQTCRAIDPGHHRPRKRGSAPRVSTTSSSQLWPRQTEPWSFSTFISPLPGLRISASICGSSLFASIRVHSWYLWVTRRHNQAAFHIGRSCNLLLRCFVLRVSSYPPLTRRKNRRSAHLPSPLAFDRKRLGAQN